MGVRLAPLVETDASHTVQVIVGSQALSHRVPVLDVVWRYMGVHGRAWSPRVAAVPAFSVGNLLLSAQFVRFHGYDAQVFWREVVGLVLVWSGVLYTVLVRRLDSVIGY